MNEHVLIVEPQSGQCAVLSSLAQQAGFIPRCVTEASAGALTERCLDAGIVLLGSGIALEEGLSLLERVLQEPAPPEVIAMVTGENRHAMNALLCAGAAEVLTDEAESAAVCEALRRTGEVAELTSDLSRIKGHPDASIRLEDLRGATEEMDRAVRLGERASRFQMHVLIEGEPGTGKRLMARAIRAGSDRASHPLVAFDCAGLTEKEADKALFDRRTGAYWRARRGSLLLEHIEALPHSAQMRLAILLETPERPARELLLEEKPEVRLLASTSSDIIPLVKSGAFNQSLFYRLNVCPIGLPPLRARRPDIPGLARGFMRAFALETGKPMEMLCPTTGELLMQYDWPGNLPELEREVFRAVKRAEGRTLEPRHFPRIAAHGGGLDERKIPQMADAGTGAQGHAGPVSGLTPPLVEGMPAQAMSRHDPEAGCVGIPALTERGDVRPLDAIEADMIRLALGRYRGSMTEAARRLGIGRSTLYRKMREFGLDARGRVR